MSFDYKIKQLVLKKKKITKSIDANNAKPQVQELKSMDNKNL